MSVNYADTREVKMVQRLLSALTKMTKEQVAKKDPIIHTTIENLFLVIFSLKSREFILYVIETHLTYQFLTSSECKLALLSDLPFVLYSFFRVLMYDPLNAEHLGSVFPCMNANTADLATQAVAGTEYPMAQILKDVSARWVHGTLDTDIVAAAVMQSVGTETKFFTGEHPSEGVQNIFERAVNIGPNANTQLTRSGSNPSLTNSQLYNANVGQPALVQQPTLVRSPSSTAAGVPFGPRGAINSNLFNTNPTTKLRSNHSINGHHGGGHGHSNSRNNNNHNNASVIEPESLIDPKSSGNGGGDDDNANTPEPLILAVAPSESTASQAPSGVGGGSGNGSGNGTGPAPPKPSRPTRPVPRRPSIIVTAVIANDDDDLVKSQVDVAGAPPSVNGTTQQAKITQIPAVSLQPYSVSTDRFWLTERSIMSQLVANVTALFHFALTIVLDTCRDSSELEICQKEAGNWITSTFEVLCIAIEELYGWEDTSVSFVRLILYAYISLLSSKVSQLYNTEATTVILSCCIVELGQFIEQFIFFRPTGAQTYLNRQRYRLHPSTYFTPTTPSSMPSFLSGSSATQQKHSLEALSAIRETYQLLNELTFHQGVVLYRQRIQDLSNGITAREIDGLPLPSVVPECAESIYASLHRELTSSVVTTNPTQNSIPTPQQLFGLHFDTNGCSDIFIVERYTYLIGSLGFGAPEKIDRSSPKEYMPSNYPHNRSLYAQPQSQGPGSGPGGMDSLRSSMNGSILQQQTFVVGHNPATSTVWTAPLPPRTARSPTGPFAGSKATSILGLEILPLPTSGSVTSPPLVTNNSDPQQQSQQQHPQQQHPQQQQYGEVPNLRFKPANNILHQYQHQVNNMGSDGGSDGPSVFSHGPGLQRSSSLIQQAAVQQAKIQCITKQNFQHLEKVLRTQSRKNFYALLTKQHSFFRTLSDLLVHVFTMPILPSTTFQFPYHNLYNDFIFKQIVPPSSELMISNRLLDQMATYQYFAKNEILSPQLQHYYGPNGEYVSDNLKFGEARPFNLIASRQQVENQQRNDHFNQNHRHLFDIHSESPNSSDSVPPSPLQIYSGLASHGAAPAISPTNKNNAHTPTSPLASSVPPSVSHPVKLGLYQSNPYKPPTDHHGGFHLPQYNHFLSSSPTNALPRSQGNLNANNLNSGNLNPLPPPPPPPGVIPPGGGSYNAGHPATPLNASQIDPALRRGSAININPSTQFQQYQQYQTQQNQLQQQQYWQQSQYQAPPQSTQYHPHHAHQQQQQQYQQLQHSQLSLVTSSSTTPLPVASPGPTPPPVPPVPPGPPGSGLPSALSLCSTGSLNSFNTTSTTYIHPTSSTNYNLQSAYETSAAPNWAKEAAIFHPAISYAGPGLAIAGTPLVELPSTAFQFNYINSHKRDTLFEHEVMFTPTAFNGATGSHSIPNGAMYCNGGPINAGFSNILSLSHAILSSHNPQTQQFTIPEYRSYIGRLIGEASERAAFKLIAAQLPTLMVEQLKLMMIKRRHSFAQRNGMVSNEIQLISDLKWRFALPQAHLRDLQQAAAQQTIQDPKASTAGLVGNQMLHFPAWAPLIAPAHHIPVMVNSNTHLMTHGLWAPVSVPTAIPVVPNSTHGGDVSDYLDEKGSDQLRCEINFTAQKVMMPITSTLDQAHVDQYLSPTLARGLETVKGNVDKYIEQEGVKLAEKYDQQLAVLNDQELVLQQQHINLERQLVQIKLEQARLHVDRDDLISREAKLKDHQATLHNQQFDLHTQRSDFELKRIKLTEDETRIDHQRMNLTKLQSEADAAAQAASIATKEAQVQSQKLEFQRGEIEKMNNDQVKRAAELEVLNTKLIEENEQQRVLIQNFESSRHMLIQPTNPVSTNSSTITTVTTTTETHIPSSPSTPPTTVATTRTTTTTEPHLARNSSSSSLPGLSGTTNPVVVVVNSGHIPSPAQTGVTLQAVSLTPTLVVPAAVATGMTINTDAPVQAAAADQSNPPTVPPVPPSTPLVTSMSSNSTPMVFKTLNSYHEVPMDLMMDETLSEAMTASTTQFLSDDREKFTVASLYSRDDLKGTRATGTQDDSAKASTPHQHPTTLNNKTLTLTPQLHSSRLGSLQKSSSMLMPTGTFLPLMEDAHSMASSNHSIDLNDDHTSEPFSPKNESHFGDATCELSPQRQVSLSLTELSSPDQDGNLSINVVGSDTVSTISSPNSLRPGVPLRPKKTSALSALGEFSPDQGENDSGEMMPIQALPPPQHAPPPPLKSPPSLPPPLNPQASLPPPLPQGNAASHGPMNPPPPPPPPPAQPAPVAQEGSTAAAVAAAVKPLTGLPVNTASNSSAPPVPPIPPPTPPHGPSTFAPTMPSASPRPPTRQL